MNPHCQSVTLLLILILCSGKVYHICETQIQITKCLKVTGHWPALHTAPGELHDLQISGTAMHKGNLGATPLGLGQL